MMARYLVDTDWVIHYLNAQPAIVARLDACRAGGVALSIVSLAELYEGVFGSNDPSGNEQTLQQFVRGVSVVGLDDATVRFFGKERARLRTAGQMIGDVDLLIGATAVARSLILLTNNRRHFERITGISIESVTV